MTDYMVFGSLQPERAAAILSGVAEGCVQAGCALIGGETAEHPGSFRAGRVRPGRRGHRRGRLRRPARPAPGAAGRRGARAGLFRPALQRVLAGPAGAGAGRAGPGGGVPRDRRDRWATSCSPRPGSTPGTAWPWPQGATCTPTPTSPAAGWPPTSPGCCPRGPTRSWTGELAAASRIRAARGARRGGGGRDGAGVQHGRRHGRRAGPRRTPTGRWACSPSAASRRGCSARSCPARGPPGWPDGIQQARPSGPAAPALRPAPTCSRVTRCRSRGHRRPRLRRRHHRRQRHPRNDPRRVGVAIRFPIVPADTQLSPQPVKVRAAAVVLQLACHLYLLGLGSAAPHWLDPLEHAEPLSGSCSLR